MAIIEVVLAAQTDDADLGQTNEELAELVVHLRVEDGAVLQEGGVDLLLVLLHLLPVAQASHV